MILLALGANLPFEGVGPEVTLSRALAALGEAGVMVAATSSLYRTSPVPPSGQPDFMNAVAVVETALPPIELMMLLRDIERRFGRTREVHWSARTLDLDLLAYGEEVLPFAHEWRQLERQLRDGGELTMPLILPHPRLHHRRFVLEPLAEVAPNWRHPLTWKRAADYIEGLDDQGICERMGELS